MTAPPLVQVEHLGRIFDVSKPWLNRMTEGLPRRFLPAVADVSFTIGRHETFALVGESGSGKSTVAKMTVGLIAPTAGEVVIDGISMTNPNQVAERRRLRRRIQIVFQDPYASLNPRWRALEIIAEPLRAFGLRSARPDITTEVHELLRLVGLDPADGAKYPHEFSGGQRQRIAIARALATRPAFIVCDEPTSALDVSVQAQILNLMRDLQDRFGPVRPHLSVHQPQSRGRAPHGEPHRRDVSRSHCRGSPRQGVVSCAAAPLHAHAARRGARPRRERSSAPAGRGRGSQSDRSAAGLCLSSALSPRERALPRRAAAADGNGSGGHGGLSRGGGRADLEGRNSATSAGLTGLGP
jgi:ABC-type dipeptide/oligopeptide/nickel transport system ATPase subunit